MDRADTFAHQEKGFTIKQRKDSSQGEALILHTRSEKDSEESREKLPDPQQQKDNLSDRRSSKEEQIQYLQLPKEETFNPTLVPIYPWIAPPTTLPGPYDAPYYPAPLPTIRRYTDDTKPEESRDIKTGETSTIPPENLETLSYTRRLPAPNTPKHPTTLSTSIIVSPNRWRRTQWTTVVSAG
jgi:hypothetical protein